MNKSQIKEVAKIKQLHAAGLDIGFVARSLSALIRSSMTNRAKIEISRIAADMGCQRHPEFIC